MHRVRRMLKLIALDDFNYGPSHKLDLASQLDSRPKRALWRAIFRRARCDASPTWPVTKTMRSSSLAIFFVLFLALSSVVCTSQRENRACDGNEGSFFSFWWEREVHLSADSDSPVRGGYRVKATYGDQAALKYGGQVSQSSSAAKAWASFGWGGLVGAAWVVGGGMGCGGGHGCGGVMAWAWGQSTSDRSERNL